MIPDYRQDALIADTYLRAHDAVCGYLYKRIRSRADAEDLTQDVFARLLEYTTLLNHATVLNLVYTIARNLLTDYLRRHARSRMASDYFFVHARRSTSETEEQIAVREIETFEKQCLCSMPQRKAQIYELAIKQGQSAAEIALQLDLSCRTVENHLFAARQQMRQVLKACI